MDLYEVEIIAEMEDVRDLMEERENKGEEEENLEPGGLGDQVGRDGPQPPGDQSSQIFIRAEKDWLAKGDEGRASFC